jgi:AbiU2
MDASKVRQDLIQSTIGAKSHFDAWWALVSEAKPDMAPEMRKHASFFLSAQDGHYMSFFIYLAHLFDKRQDSSSISKFLNLTVGARDAAKESEFRSRLQALSIRAEPLVIARHKSVAHIDAKLTEQDVFAPLNITWHEVRDFMKDVVELITELVGATHPGDVGIPADGMLKKATMKALHALRRGTEA